MLNKVLGDGTGLPCTWIWYDLYKIADKTARNFYYGNFYYNYEQSNYSDLYRSKKMSSLIRTLRAIYPEQVFLEITPEDMEAASPNNSDYSYDVARRHALINRLVLNCFTNWLRMEAPIE